MSKCIFYDFKITYSTLFAEQIAQQIGAFVYNNPKQNGFK